MYLEGIPNTAFFLRSIFIYLFMIAEDWFLCTRCEKGEINKGSQQENRFLVPRDVLLLPLV